MTDFAKLVLDADTTGLKRAEGDLRSVTQSAGMAAQNVGKKMAALGAGMTVGLTAPLTLFGKASFQAAVDAAEMQSAFEVTFGGAAKSVEAWAERTGDAFGRSTTELQEMAMSFQDILKKQMDPAEAVDLSKSLTVLTQDLASFKNLSNDVAKQKIFSGLIGEAEPLRAVGVTLSAAKVEAKALEMGLTGVNGKLTEGEKVQARAAVIMDELADAQGDVLRTSDSTANQIKRAQAAFADLQITVGQKLIPALTPFIEKLGAALELFTSLPDPVQNTALILGGIIAVAGPLLTVAGGLVTLLPVLTGAFAGLAIPLLPLAAIVAGVAAAGYLIYANWDKIAPLFEQLRTRFEEALGPRIQEAFQKIKEVATELWEGPFGDGIRKVIDFVWQFQSAYFSVLGEGLVRVLGAAVEIVAGAFEQIGNVIKFVAALLTGDFSGAWKAARDFIETMVSSAVRVVDALFPGIGDTIIKTVQAIKHWLGSVLGGVFDSVKRKIHEVNDAFFWLYDQVVGHSHVPDMVDGIAAEMARLDSVMVDPARKAAQSVDEAMRDMASKTQALLARLFPEVEKARQMAADLATIEASGLSEFDQSRARRALRDEYFGGGLPVSTVSLEVPKILDIADATKAAADKTGIQTVRIAESFKDMAQNVTTTIGNLAKAIKGGDFFDILDAAVGLFTQLGGAGLFGSKIQSNMNSSFGGFRANGGPVMSGKTYLVGERGPELLTMGGRGHITANDNMGGKLDVSITMDESTGRLGAFVRNQAGNVVAQAAAPISDWGAAKGQARIRQQRNRSLVA